MHQPIAACPFCDFPSVALVEMGDSDRVTVDECGRCAGIWFDADELETLLGRKNLCRQLQGRVRCRHCGKRGDPDPEGACTSCGRTSWPNCPRGHGLLQTRSLAGILVEHCSTCLGFWLGQEALLSVADIVGTSQPSGQIQAQCTECGLLFAGEHLAARETGLVCRDCNAHRVAGKSLNSNSSRGLGLSHLDPGELLSAAGRVLTAILTQTPP